MMNHEEKLGLLKFPELRQCWKKIETMCDQKNISKSKMLESILEILVNAKQENLIASKMKKAFIPKMYSLNTFPFEHQTVKIEDQARELHDSLSYIKNGRNIILIGPTGTGKTGLATSFLVNAIQQGYTGKFYSFANMISEIAKATQLMRDRRLISKLTSFDCLVIDEIGYRDIDKQYISAFFEIISGREDKCTIITSNLGFNKWDSFLKDKQITAAILDRLTAKTESFDLTDGNSIRGADT